MNNMGRNIALWIIIALLLLTLFNLFQGQSKDGEATPLAFSEFLDNVESGQIRDVTIEGNQITGHLTGTGQSFSTYAPDDPALVSRLRTNGVLISAKPSGDGQVSPFYGVLLNWLPMLLIIGVWIFFMRQMQGGGGKAMGFGKSRARMLTEKQGRITFDDVAGIDEAKEELQEIVEFLKSPQKFQRLGGRIPKGALLIGPPGTGKTLLARAIAGEANVPFFTISGSDFVELFVGVGASRVRDMFEQGKKNAPCIIFIDEIDAVGRHRGAGLGVDSKVIARGTPGFSGADLANLVNEAALLAARVGRRVVTMAEFETAKDKVMMGPERRSAVMSEDEKKITAYHEAGHALVGMKVPGHDPLHKVTIIPRGRALGVTMSLPERDRYSHTKQEIESRLASLYGGRVAEELIFGAEHITTDAANDIQQATGLARKMVTEWGMSEKLGPLLYDANDEEVFLGHSVTQHKNVSDATAALIDQEIRNLIEGAEETARKILTNDIDSLHKIAGALLEYETLGAAEVDSLLKGEDIMRDSGDGPPSDSNGKRSPVPASGSASNTPSDLAPNPQASG